MTDATSPPLGRLPGPLPWSIEAPNGHPQIIAADGKAISARTNGWKVTFQDLVAWINEVGALHARASEETGELLSRAMAAEAKLAEKDAEIERLKVLGGMTMADIALDMISDLKEKLAAATLRIEAYEEALKPSGATKTEYIGEFDWKETEDAEDEDGDIYTITKMHVVPWITIKEIMKAISDRAARSWLTPAKGETHED